MTHEDYRRALEAATREYEELGAKRQEIDNRLAELAQTIGTLSKLLGLTPTVPMGLTARGGPAAAAVGQVVALTEDPLMDLDLRRRFFAEELEAVCNFRSPGLLDAFAAVPRERFLAAGPWTVLGDAGDGFMMGGPPRTRTTPDADPARVYHNIAIAIDPARQLFNGQPGTLAVWLDVLGLAPGSRVLHVGCGLGYYTAVIA